MATRYYLHGDEHESEAGRYYCASCDLFFNPEHFDEPRHQENAEPKFRATQETLSVLTKQKGARYSRPNDAPNILLPFPSNPPEKVGRFFRWLKRQVERDDPIGDLAEDVLRDTSFPKSTEAREVLRDYLETKRACTEALVALDEALAEFHASRPTRGAISPKLRFEVFKRDEYRCRICGSSAQDGVQLEVDHVHPVSKGGTSDMANLQTLCKPCNRGKGASDL
jgi:uncharacterized protein YozE (UPF0346 family)